jgi:hypothetical protein
MSVIRHCMYLLILICARTSTVHATFRGYQAKSHHLGQLAVAGMNTSSHHDVPICQVSEKSAGSCLILLHTLSLSVSSINNTCWRPPVPAPLTVVGVEAVRATLRVSSSVCRDACVQHSAEITHRRLRETPSPPNPPPNVEDSAHVHSCVGSVVLVRFAVVCHIFCCFPPARGSDLLPYQLFLLAEYTYCLYH